MATEEIKEPRTQQVEMMPGCYTTWDTKVKDGNWVVEVNEKGKQERVWKGDRFWVHPGAVKDWTTETHPERPLVKVIGTRSEEDAKNDVVPQTKEEVRERTEMEQLKDQMAAQANQLTTQADMIQKLLDAQAAKPQEDEPKRKPGRPKKTEG